MGFKKGNKLSSGRPKGSKDKKTQEWNSIGEFLTTQGSVRLLEIMQTKLDDKEYVDCFMKILEYFKPKLARNETKVDQQVTFTQYDNKPDSELEEELNRLSAALSREEQKKV